MDFESRKVTARKYPELATRVNDMTDKAALVLRKYVGNCYRIIGHRIFDRDTVPLALYRLPNVSRPLDSFLKGNPRHQSGGEEQYEGEVEDEEPECTPEKLNFSLHIDDEDLLL